MSNLKLKLNGKGVAELMKSDDMINILEEAGRTVVSRCGDGYEMDSYVGKNRANVSVSATTFKAKRDNSKNNTLLKALGK